MSPLAILLAPIIRLIVRSWRIYVCTDGLLVKARRVAALRWDQIEALWQKPHQGEFLWPGIRASWPGSDYCDLIVCGYDGKKVLLERHLWRRFVELHMLLDQQISASRLPYALSALNAGTSLTFGHIQVDQHGVRLLKESGQASDPVPWAQIADMKIQRGGPSFYYVVIERHDQRRLTWQLPALANASLLLAIKDFMVRQHGGEPRD